MRRLLLLLALLICFLCQAQDYDYIKTLNSLDKTAAKAFGDKLVAGANTKWIYLYEKANDKSIAEWYIDASVPAATVELIKAGKELTKPGQCLVVRFSQMGQSYRFTEVTGKYEDLLPAWQSIFKPDATTENVPTTYNMRELKQKETGISYKFTKNDNSNYWTLQNWTYLK